MDINGYGFNGIGSLEEYFAYDIDEYYDSIESGKHTPYKLNVDGVDVVSDILFIY